jgi:hypothetical protein
MGPEHLDSDRIYELEAFTEGDPTIRAHCGFRFEIHPMPFGVVRA